MITLPKHTLWQRVEPKEKVRSRNWFWALFVCKHEHQVEYKRTCYRNSSGFSRKFAGKTCVDCGRVISEKRTD